MGVGVGVGGWVWVGGREGGRERRGMKQRDLQRNMAFPCLYVHCTCMYIYMHMYVLVHAL